MSSRVDDQMSMRTLKPHTYLRYLQVHLVVLASIYMIGDHVASSGRQVGLSKSWLAEKSPEADSADA